ncbi:restriction endonuclease subunit S [Tenacibaculum finnmarkense]|uniref:restriction endonuclease subunit S n=1 Tax=Tenacibaculum finnmarkense TaxID=2781243 RepID=UPI0023015017|nr:restriction endonuclease subunit S [Tenacibaculum finnmarkense]WCC46644.1 restriction endonuclease subunit S [Tenacibaculum finnmarkense]
MKWDIKMGKTLAIQKYLGKVKDISQLDQTKIDSDFKNVRFSELGDIKIGLTHKPDYIETGVPFLSSKNISNGYIDFDNIKYISKEKFESMSDSTKPKVGDILFTRVGSNLGNPIIVEEEKEFGIFVSLGFFRVKRNIDNRYIKYWMESTHFWKQVEQKVAGGAKNNLNSNWLKEFKLSIPPLKEQQKIAKILSTWDEAIETTQSLIEKLQFRKKGLMQELLSGKKRLAGFSEQWEENNLGGYFTERKETGLEDLELLSVGKEGVYPQDNSNKKDTSNSNKSKYKRICKGDIGYNTMRMWQGRSALSNLEGIVSPAYTILNPKENCDSVFFSHLFKLDDMIHKFYRNSQGMVSDTWMCKFKDLKIIKFNAPSSLSEQKAISKIIDLSDIEISEKKAYLLQLKNQKKGLMQQLLTGKKRVKL